MVGSCSPPIAYPRGNKKVLYGVYPYNTSNQVQICKYALQNGFVRRIIDMQTCGFYAVVYGALISVYRVQGVRTTLCLLCTLCASETIIWRMMEKSKLNYNFLW
ncbi:hypothetical protein, partial [Hydrogenoanaerobacterium saccharovorans]|uniref:hypothetical protein n=1 Tax=Hydrogenoanaerobacterium saccharovorans TaxID=474960 RepID=UPI00196849B0